MLTTLINGFGYLAAFAFPFGQLTRLSLSNQQVNVYLYEVFLAFSLFFLIVRYRASSLRMVKLTRYISIFILTLTTSFALSFWKYDWYENTVGLLYLARLVLYLAYLIYFIHHVGREKRNLTHLGLELSITAISIGSICIVQYMFYPNLRNLLYMGWDPHLYRVFGFFFEPYLAGSVLALSFLYILFHGRKVAKWRLFILPVLFILIMLTFSRTVYAAILITLFMYFLKDKKYAMLAVLGVAFIVLAFTIPKPEGVGVQLFRTFSIQSRMSDIEKGIDMWKRSPLTGVGYNRLRYAKANLGIADKWDSSHSGASYHSSFVTLLATGGIVSFAFFCLMLWKFSRISKYAAYYIIFLTVVSLGDNALLHPFILFYISKLLVFESNQSSLE